MASVYIRTAAIQYPSHIVECHCLMNVMTPAGPLEVIKVVPLDEATMLTADWTDADLCEAVATELGINVTEVEVLS